jgi:hypothetical protein
MGGRRIKVLDIQRGWRGRYTRLGRGRLPTAGEHGGQPKQSGRAVEARNAGGATTCIGSNSRNEDRLARAGGIATALRFCAAANPDDALPPAETSGAVWREQQMSGGTGQVEAAPCGSMGCPPTGTVHEAELMNETCVGDAASAVDPDLLSKVSISNSSQFSKPPFLWNPYLWYLGHRSGVSPRENHLRAKARGLTTRRLLQAVVWMSVMPEMIMQSTRNMLEVWPMLAEVTVKWTAPRLLAEAEVQPALSWQESFGGILAANVFERFASETPLDKGMRPTERQEHVLIAAMLARDNPEDAITLLYEYKRVDCLFTTEMLVEWYRTKHSNWQQGILRHLVAEAVSACEQSAAKDGEPELAPMQGNMYEGALHLSQEHTHDQPRIPFPLIAIRRGCYSEMESGGVVGLVKEDIRAAYVAGSQDGPYHIHPGSQAGYDYLLSEGSVVLRADGQERSFTISRMNAHGKPPLLAPSVAQTNAAAGAGDRAARHTAEQSRTIKIAYDGLPVGGRLGDYSFTQAMRVIAYRTQQLTPSPKVNFNQPTDDEGYLISELDAYLVFPESASPADIRALPWEKFRHVPYLAGAKPMMGFVARKWMEKIGRKKCCWKREDA